MLEPTSTTPRLRIHPDRKVLLCVGPGGVGKTTVAAALGLEVARSGRRVLVVTIDPSRRLAQALGIETDRRTAAGEIVTVPGTAEAGAPLDALLLDTQSVFDAIVRGYSPDANAADRMLVNPIYRATVQRLGGALEYAATAQVHMLVAEGKYDLIILDTPPTANAIEFLDAPGRIMEVLDNPAAKFLASSSRIGMKFMGLASSVMLKAFESIGGGPFIGQLGEFLRDFGAVLGEFKRRAGDVANLLVSSDTGVVLTTAATVFTVREAKAFLDELRARRLRIDGVVLNRVDPPVPPMPSEGLIEAALQTQLGREDVSSQLQSIVSTYRGARAQSRRAQDGHDDLDRSYPDVPVCVLWRMTPPPVGVEELRAMGAQLLAV